MSDQRSRYFVEVVGLDQLRQWSAEQATLEKRALAVQRAMLQTAAASERYDSAAKQSALATARVNTEMTRAAEIAGRMATAEQRLALEQERVAQSAQRLALALARAAAGSTALETRMKASREVASAVGNGLLNVAGGIVSVGVASAKLAADFERDLTTVRTNTTMNSREFAEMRRVVLDLSKVSGQSFRDIAEGYMHAANFGYHFADAQKIVTVANQAAVATGSSTASTTQLLAKAMREFNIPTSEAGRTMNVFWYAAANSDAKMKQFVDTGGRAFAMAGALGIGINEAAAALSLYNTKLKSSDATTQFISDMNKLLHPTAEVRKEIATLDAHLHTHLAESFSLSGVRAHGLTGAFDEMRHAAQLLGIPVAQLAIDLFPNLRGTIGAVIGTSDTGMDGLKGRLVDIAALQRGQSNPVMSAYEERLKTADQQLKVLEQTIKGEFLPIGQKFIGLMKDAIPIIKSLANDIAALMKWFMGLPKPVQEGVIALGAFRLATMALGNPLVGLGGLIRNLITLFRGVPAAAAEAEAGIAAVRAASAGSAASTAASAGTGMFALGARGVAARVAGPIGIAVTGATALGFLANRAHDALYPNTPDIADEDARQADVAAGQQHARGLSTETYAQMVARMQAQSNAQSIFSLFPNFVKPSTAGNPAADKAAMDAYNQMKAGAGKKGKGSGSSSDPEREADRRAELNKQIRGETFTLTHSDSANEMHDAAEKAHDWINQGADPSLVGQWLQKKQYGIQLKSQVDQIREFQENQQKPYELSMLQTGYPTQKEYERAADLFMPGGSSMLMDLQSGGTGLGMTRDAAEERQRQIERNAAASQQAREEADRQYSKTVSGTLDQMGRDNTSALDRIAPAPDTGETGQLLSLYRKRSQQQSYADTLSTVLESGIAPDNTEELSSHLQTATDEIAKLNIKIAELTAKIHDNTAAQFPTPATAAQRADAAAKGLVDRLQQGAAAGSVIGRMFDRKGRTGGADIGAGIGALADAFGPRGTSKYVQAASGAFGAFQTGQQQGAVGGAVSGAASGAGIGALFGPGGAAIGAAAGGFLGLLGGLFGGHHRPDTTNRDTNPAFTYAPSGFDESAYRFRVTGQLPTSQQLGLNLPNMANQPIQVVVNLDGVKQTISTLLGGATTTAAASLQNSFPNLSRPL